MPWLPAWETIAVRDLATRLINRRWPAEGVIFGDAAEGFAFDLEGRLYPTAPRVNWPLLALCRAVVALPLVLAWLALRWRRKRRPRIASVSP